MSEQQTPTDPSSTPPTSSTDPTLVSVPAISHQAVAVISSPDQVSARRWRVQEGLAIVGGFGLFALMVATLVQPQPPVHLVFLSLAAFVFFLYPFRRVVVPRRLLQMGVALFVLWLMMTLSGVLFPFIVAIVLAYLFSPLVDRLHRLGVPRWVTTLVIVLLIPGIYTLIGVFILPELIDQASTLIATAKTAMQNSKQPILDHGFFIQIGASLGIDAKTVEEFMTKTAEPELRKILSGLALSTTKTAETVTKLLEGAFNLVLIPILTFSILKDFHRLRTWIRRILLQDSPRRVELANRADTIVSSYLRGILLTSTLVAVLASITFVAFGVPYGAVIGILTGVFNLIPIFGMFLNLGVAMVIYLIASPGSFLENTLITAATIAALHALNSYVIEPRVIGERVGLHPVLVIASLFVFGHFLGFVGMLIAVPTAAVIQMLLKEWYTAMQARKTAETVANISISTT